MNGDPRFLAALEQIRQMHIKKGADYGTHTDTFANVRASEEFGIPGWLGSVMRANDKMARLKAFAVNGKLENESVEDSLLDLANYALIGLVLWRDEQPKIEAATRPTVADTYSRLTAIEHANGNLANLIHDRCCDGEQAKPTGCGVGGFSVQEGDTPETGDQITACAFIASKG